MTSNKLTKEEKKVLTGWGTALLVIVVILLIINFFFPVKTIINQIKSSDNESFQTGNVSDYSRYATIASTVEKMYAYANMKDYDSVIMILDKDYVKENKITNENVSDYVDFKDKKVAFIPDIMYLVKGKNGIYEYCVSGSLVYSNTGEKIKDVYYTVILDGNTFLFSVKPIEEKDFKEVQHEFKG